MNNFLFMYRCEFKSKLMLTKIQLKTKITDN